MVKSNGFKILGALLWICAIFPLSAQADSWEKVRAVLDKYHQQGTLNNSLLEIRTIDHNLVFQYQTGSVDRVSAKPVLSSGKWISAATMMSLVDQGFVRLDDPISQYLKNRNGSDFIFPLNQITLRQVLSFQSGLPENNPCYQNPNLTIEECGHRIFESASPFLTPGQEFSYGNTNFTVAALVAMQATGKTWQQIFDENIVLPLGLQSSPAYYAKPKKLRGTGNPSPGHGLVISYDDYLRFMEMIVDHGNFRGQNVLSSAAVDAIETDAFTVATAIGHSPTEGTSLYPFGHYGLGAWHECSDFSCTNFVTSSPGLFGFYPWLDRKAGYYAILGGWEFGQENIFKANIELVQELKPLIEQALAEDDVSDLEGLNKL